MLVENGGDTNATNKDNKNPLCLATASGHLEIISYLLTIEHDSNTMMDDKNVTFSFNLSFQINMNDFFYIVSNGLNVLL